MKKRFLFFTLVSWQCGEHWGRGFDIMFNLYWFSFDVSVRFTDPPEPGRNKTGVPWPPKSLEDSA